MSSDFLIPLTEACFESITALRPNETKVGEVLKATSTSKQEKLADRLKESYDNGARYGILLVPEDIGPRGNLGRAGAQAAPDAFLSSFCNMQVNKFFDYSLVAVAGKVNTESLQSKSQGSSKEELRSLCTDLDILVRKSVESILEAGLKPIVIGGGNNNSLPTIQAVASKLSLDKGVDCVNCDPHADYRALEGRHSGNPFSYANKEKLLNKYLVFAMHESYNSQDMVERLENDGYDHIDFEDLINTNTSFEELLDKAIEYFKDSKQALGVELDLDSIKFMPSSALTPIGITEEQALRFIYKMTTSKKSLYLHLSEGAPSCTTDDGTRIVGKFLAYAVNTFLKADLNSQD